MTRDERQKICVDKWIKNKCKGTLVAGTGFGKTRTALKCLKEVFDRYPHFTALIVVPTDNLKDQWRQQLDAWGMEFNTDVQIINTVIRRNWKTTILVLDEIQRYSSDSFVKVFETVQYSYVLGLTATFERLDGKHVIMNKYCPVIDEITMIEALSNNWISHFKEYQVILDVPDIDIYKDYNRDFIKYFEFFNFDWNLAMSCIGKNGFINRAKLRDLLCPNGTESERKNIFQQITINAINFTKTVQKRKAFINNHPKKLEIARKIIEARPNSKILTFSNSIKMAEAIGIGNVYAGKDSKKKARITLEEFNNISSGVLNSSKKLIAGADIKGLSVAIMLGIDSSNIRAVQSRGRVIRFEEGKQAEIFNLIIDQTVETTWFSNSHSDGNYITIDEEGLDDVLNYREPKPYYKKLKDYTFRY